MEELTIIKNLVKQCLGIVSTATIKDDEIELLINTAIADMKRLAIEIDLSNPLQQSAIVQYVKANFGMTDTATKQMCLNSYNLLVSSIQCNVDETEV